MSPLPKPPPSVEGSMPQMRRRSSIRTATGQVEEQFLERVRAVADDPTLVLPDRAEGESSALSRLRARLGKATDGGALPFMARFDKGLLGALHAARQLAKAESAPRLLDARVDGNRRFFLQRGHAKRLLNLAVQNWDDPVALLLAYGQWGPSHGLHFFAGSRLWCSGATPRPPAQWYADLAERSGVALDEDAEGAACPHADRAQIELRFRGGPRILVCGPCGRKAGEGGVNNMHGHLLNRYLSEQPSRPVEVAARLPDGALLPLSDGHVNAYRSGKNSEEDLLEVAVKSWRGQAGSAGAGRFVLGARDFGSDQAAFLGALDLADWEREPVRILTAGGHVGEAAGTADVLAAHRGSLAAALDAILGDGQGQAFLSQHPGGETRTLLRLAREEALLRAKTRDMPAIAGLGGLGAWIDGFARDARTLDRAALLQRVRREAPAAAHPAHFYAFLAALGMESEGARGFGHDQKEAGRHWAPLAKVVLEASGPAYREAVLAYLRETGAGESA